MPKGLWVWPADPKGQRRALARVASSPHLMAAMDAMAKSKEGLSNPELDDAINDSAEWTTLWVVRQLTSLGFVEYKVDLFGNPARYQLNDQGWAAYTSITGKPKPAPRPPQPAQAAQSSLPPQPRPQQAPAAPKAA